MILVGVEVEKNSRNVTADSIELEKHMKSPESGAFLFDEQFPSKKLLYFLYRQIII